MNPRFVFGSLLLAAGACAFTYYLVKSDADARFTSLQHVREIMDAAHAKDIELLHQEIDALRLKLLREDVGSAIAPVATADGPPAAAGAGKFSPPTTNLLPEGTRLVRVLPDGLLLATGIGLSKRTWEELPDAVTQYYSVNAAEAATRQMESARDSTQLARRTERLQKEDAQKKAEVEAKLKKEYDARQLTNVTGRSWVIKGKVISKSSNGLFVSSVSGHSGSMRTLQSSIAPDKSLNFAEEGLPIYGGTCLLKNHPQHATIVDGDEVSVQATESGIYQYTTVLGAEATVKEFTID